MAGLYTRKCDAPEAHNACCNIAWLLKTHTLEVRRNFIALGCPINDVLDFVDISYPSAGTVFSKEGVFQQPLAISLSTVFGAQMPG